MSQKDIAFSTREIQATTFIQRSESQKGVRAVVVEGHACQMKKNGG